MRQPSLFDEKRESAPGATVGPEYIRKSLNRLLRMARAAEVMPWAPDEAASWEKLFLQLVPSLPAEEGDALRKAFVAELTRLRAAA